MRFQEHFQYQHSDCTIVSDEKDAIKCAKGTLIKDLEEFNIFIKNNPQWKESLIPITNNATEEKNIPESALLMERYAKLCDVGPMAAVAGVFADRMVDEMKKIHGGKVNIVENGGEITIDTTQNESVVIGLYVLTTSLKANLGFRINKDDMPLGIGTSSGQFGHAFSFGKADAVTVFAENAGLADTAATRICNEVVGKDKKNAVLEALELVDEIDGVKGALINYGGYIGQKGNVPELVKLKNAEDHILKKKFS